MHEVNATAATFRFPLLRSMTVPRELIVAVRVVDERPRNVTRLGLGRTGLLIELREPLFVTQPFMRPCAQRLFVGADDPHALAAALAVRESAKPER
jgi:hypothetical protein